MAEPSLSGATAQAADLNAVLEEAGPALYVGLSEAARERLEREAEILEELRAKRGSADMLT